MPVEKKPRAKPTKKTEKVQDDSSSDDEIQTNGLNTNKETNIIMSNDNDYVSKKSKAYNAELFKLLENLNKNKQIFEEAVSKLEDYNYEKFSELEHEYEKKEREFYEKSENLKKNFDEMQTKLNKSYEDLQNKLNKEFSEKKYKTEKDFDEKNYELEKLYQEKKYNFEHDYRKTIDEMERKKENDSYKFCLEVLKQKGETTIKISELNEKNQKLENMANKHEEELEKLEEKLNEQHEKEMKYELEKIQLTNKSVMAELTAQNDQKVKQIEVMKDTIDTLKKEINEQRTLTKHVAEAGKQGQIVQNMGNK
jgi:chromosome segregation ATPase